MAEDRGAVTIREETDRIYKSTDTALDVFGVGQVRLSPAPGE